MRKLDDIDSIILESNLYRYKSKGGKQYGTENNTQAP